MPASAQAASSAGASPDAPTRADPGLAVGRPDRNAAGDGHDVRASAKPGVPFAFSSIWAVEKPQAATAFGLGEREIHDSAAVAVHPQRRDEMSAEIDDGDRMALLLGGRMGRASGDDRLRRLASSDLLGLKRDAAEPRRSSR